MFIQIAQSIWDWSCKCMGFAPQYCAICPAKLGKDHATILYKVSDDPNIQEMKVCKQCMDDLEKKSVEAKKCIKGLKDDAV